MSSYSLLLGIIVNAKVTREDITSAHRALTAAVQLDNQCTTSADCTVLPTGSRACGGPSGHVVYATKSSNAKQIRSLAQLTTTLERQFNNENSIMSICSILMPPTPVCDDTNNCAAGSASPFLPFPMV
mgnify:CR=1 FL=1